MTATLLDGKAVAKEIRDELEARVANVVQRLGRPPALAIVLVGDDPASEVYVRNKLKTAEDAGMGVHLERLPGSSSLAAVLAVVDRINKDPNYDGILVQSPLPKTLGADAEQRVFDAIDPGKDVDGFSPISAGRVSQNREGFAPCTPAGVIELLVRTKTPVEGKHAVVIGRSDIVGKPMAALLAAQERHGDDLSFADTRPAGNGTNCRYPRRSDRAARIRYAGFREARRRRHRRGHQFRHLGRGSEANLRALPRTLAGFSKTRLRARRRRTPRRSGDGRRPDARAGRSRDR